MQPMQVALVRLPLKAEKKKLIPTTRQCTLLEVVYKKIFILPCSIWAIKGPLRSVNVVCSLIIHNYSKSVRSKY